MIKQKQTMDWKSIFFLTLIVSSFFFVFVYTFPNSFTSSTQTPEGDGKWVTMYSDLNDLGVRVYYQSYVLANGVSESHFIGVCDETTKECRKPTSEELRQDKYLPQSPLN